MSSLIPPLPVSGGRPLPTKVVVRLLPPVIEESKVLAACGLEKGAEWTRFVPGNRPERPTPENPTVNSRMYLQFKTFQQASEFIKKNHGKIFQDEQTSDSFRAVAAFSPYQRVAKLTRQLGNPLEGSVEDSDHFQAFIEKGPEKLSSEQFTGIVQKDAVAPLVAALVERNERLNEEIEKRRATAKKENKLKAKPPPPPKPPKKSAPAARDNKKVPNVAKSVLKKSSHPPPPPPPRVATDSVNR